jgi:hypothetical protein
MRFFANQLQAGQTVNAEGFANGLQALADAVELMQGDGCYITWSALNIPTIHVDLSTSSTASTAGLAMVEVTVMTSWRLDKENHKFQVKTRTVKVAEPSDESEWIDITDENGGELDEGALP